MSGVRTSSTDRSAISRARATSRCPDLAKHRDEIAAAKRPVVVVCLTDKRSAAAATQLAASGVAEIAVLRGGMKAWRKSE
jgi:rhodanese-related sulfurtransferase